MSRYKKTQSNGDNTNSSYKTINLTIILNSIITPALIQMSNKKIRKGNILKKKIRGQMKQEKFPNSQAFSSMNGTQMMKSKYLKRLKKKIIKKQ